MMGSRCSNSTLQDSVLIRIVYFPVASRQVQSATSLFRRNDAGNPSARIFSIARLVE